MSPFSKGFSGVGNGDGDGGGVARAGGVGGGLWRELWDWGVVLGFLALGVAFAELWYFESRRWSGHPGNVRVPGAFGIAPFLQAGLFWGLGLPALSAGLVFRGWLGRIGGTYAVWVASFATLSWFSRLDDWAAWVLSLGLGYRFGGWLEERRVEAARWGVRGIPALGVLFGACAWLESRGFLDKEIGGGSRAEVRASGGDGEGAVAGGVGAGGPNVLFLVLDTLRADATGLVPGGDAEATPFLSRLAERGVSFGRAIAPSSWTTPSHASMFTGLPAEQLGVGPMNRLEDRFRTLAEALRERGYATLGFSANYMNCSTVMGMSQGFEEFSDDPPGLSFARATRLGERLEGGLVLPLATRAMIWAGLDFEEVFRLAYHDKIHGTEINRRIMERLGGREGVVGNRPTLLFANYMDAHNPYFGPSAREVSGGSGAGAGRRGTAAEFRALNRTPYVRDALLEPHAEALREAYRECVSRLDGYLEELFVFLEGIGFLEDCVVVVTSDHGESLGEHGIFTHGRSLHQTEIHVPLLIVAPGRAPEGAFVEGVATLNDVGATILDLAGLDAGFPGRSMRGMWESAGGGDGDGSRSAFSTLGASRPLPHLSSVVNRMAPPVRSVVRGRHSYIEDFETEMLFDLESDPGEERNLVGEARARGVLEEAREAIRRHAAENRVARRLFGID